MDLFFLTSFSVSTPHHTFQENLGCFSGSARFSAISGGGPENFGRFFGRFRGWARTPPFPSNEPKIHLDCLQLELPVGPNKPYTNHTIALISGIVVPSAVHGCVHRARYPASLVGKLRASACVEHTVFRTEI